MPAALLIIAATLSANADPPRVDPQLVKRVEQYAESLAKRKIPDGKMLRVALKVPHEKQTYFGKTIAPPSDPITFLIWLPPAPSQHPQLWKPNPKSENARAEFAKWASGFLANGRKIFVSQFDNEEDAKDFVESTLRGISRNATGLRIERNEATVIWGDGVSMDRQ